jgi:hypothetical protein
VGGGGGRDGDAHRHTHADWTIREWRTPAPRVSVLKDVKDKTLARRQLRGIADLRHPRASRLFTFVQPALAGWIRVDRALRDLSRVERRNRAS